MIIDLPEVPAKETGLPPVANNIFAPSAENPGQFELLGSCCDACDDYSFPSSEYCHHCHADTRRVSLGADGVIYSFTIIRTRPPLGLPQPYGVAYIDLKNVPLRVFCLLDPEQIGDATIGASVRLSVGQLGVNNVGQDCIRPFFQLLPENRGI